MTKNILITGGCGFIGHHFVEHIIINTDWNIYIIDKLSYASMGLKRLKDEVFQNAIKSNRLKIFTWDLINEISVGLFKEINNTNIIVHMAAETHVDNSIEEPVKCIQNNIMSTVTMLEFARKLTNLETFFYFSTDEVYGPALNDKMYKEDERHNPTNPYSASKSGAEQICVSYRNTYNIPIIRINVMNAFGERQHVEKFIPKVIKSVLNGDKVYIHSYPDKKTSGTRYYIHSRNIAEAVLFLLKKGNIGESYNLTGEQEISNLEMAQMISKVIGKPLNYELVDFHSSRPGHDLRYGLDGNKMYSMGWKLPIDFQKSLENMIKWTLKNQEWLEEI
jgi:dTDP-glucose 4,6-dehydratase|tara:strand:- start:328 stop:1329 length:1002 start_codon:yes stop_codon:yes gene_type:complete